MKKHAYLFAWLAPTFLMPFCFQDRKQEQVIRARAQKMANYREVAEDAQFRLMEKQEMKAIRDKEKAEAKLMKEKRLHEADAWSAEDALRGSVQMEKSAADAKIMNLQEKRKMREDEHNAKRMLKDGWDVSDSLRDHAFQKQELNRDEAKIERLAEQRIERERVIAARREEHDRKRRGRRTSIVDTGMGDIFRTATSVPRGVIQRP